MRLAWLWGLSLVATVGLVADCGAISLEPLPPEEPLPEAAPPPRLTRKDASAPKASAEEEEDPR